VSFQLSIVAPDRTVFENKVTSIVVPGVEGYLGIMSNHEPIIAALDAGVVEAKDETGYVQNVAIAGGFLEASDNKVIILANDAQLSSEVDIAQAEKELDEARKALRGEPSSVQVDFADDVLRRSMARIRAAKKTSN
jgi:F-type H+-transporting ATPase subunit epsilon